MYFKANLTDEDDRGENVDFEVGEEPPDSFCLCIRNLAMHLNEIDLVEAFKEYLVKRFKSFTY